MPAARPKKHGFAHVLNYQQDFHPKLATTPRLTLQGPNPAFLLGEVCYWKWHFSAANLHLPTGAANC